MSARRELVDSAAPTLARHAVAQPDSSGLADVPDRSRAFTLEAVREGYLMHYDEPRAFAGLDANLALLGGDSLYALGLSRLAEEGDLAAVAELADLISTTARARAEGRTDLAERLWRSSVERLSGNDDRGALRTWRDFA